MDASAQLMIMQQNAQQYQTQQHQQHQQMHNAPQTLMQPMRLPSLPNAGVQVIWRCGYDSQNRKICWRVN